MSVKEKLCGIYCIENLVSHKVYVGQSIDIEKRWKNHKNTLNRGVHRNFHLQRAWYIYGQECFNFYILELCHKDELDKMECYYIEKFNSTSGDCGYNSQPGGSDCKVLSDEARSKISSANLGRVFSEEHKNNIRNALIGHAISSETKSKISNAKSGIVLTEEHKQKISDSVSGCKNPRAKPIYCLELNEVFWGATEASQKYNIDRRTISSCCGGKAKSAGKHPTTGEPLHWTYVNDAKTS